MKLKRFLQFYAACAAFWMLYFAAARALFWLFRPTAGVAWSDIAGSFAHGCRMDASFTGYLLVLTGVLLALLPALWPAAARHAVRLANLLPLAAIGALTVVDAELFGHWGFRLDASPLQYLDHPKEVLLGALAWWQALLLLALMAAWIVAWSALLLRGAMRLLPRQRMPWYGVPAFLLLAALCIVPIRGSFSTAPMNQGMVAFSRSTLANQAALNMPWNLMYDLLHRSAVKRYSLLPHDEAERIAGSCFNRRQDSTIHVLRRSIAKPNVLIVILESWTKRFVGCIGGEAGLTPCFDSLANSGLLFTRIYASGHRTERGLAAVLSGYPSQTGMPVTGINGKMQRLPALARAFAGNGYSTCFFYGGDISFVNMRSYVLAQGFERYVAAADFPSVPTNKWGVHDEFLYARLLRDLDTMRKPFFAAALTLSNHEPYDVPMKPALSGTPDDAMRNAVVYADRCIGQFVERCRRQAWWDSTLLVFVADHGKPLEHDARFDTTTLHIPLLWLGGALDSTGRFDRIASQHDLAATLLAQLNMPAGDFRLSRNILSTHGKPFAMHIFNDGFTLVTDSAATVFDNTLQRPVLYATDSATLTFGKALFQLYNDELWNSD